MQRTAIILILMLSLFAATAAAQPATDYEPRLVIVDKDLPTASPGEEIVISFTIKNVGWTARRISVTPVLEDANQPLSAASFTVNRFISELTRHQSARIEFALKISPQAVAGVYPLQLHFEYSNIYGDNFTQLETIFLEITGDVQAAPQLAIRQLELNPDSVTAGETVEANMIIENTGASPAREVVLAVEELGESFSLLNSTNKLRLGDIAPGEVKTASITVAVAGSISPGSNRFKAIIFYDDDRNRGYSVEEVVFIPINTVKEEIKEPRLIIRDVQLEPQSLQPGSLGELSLVVDNAGEGEASAIQIALSGLQNAKLALRKGTNVHYVDSLAAGKTTTVVYQLLALEEIDTESAMLTVEITCQDESGAEYRQAQDLFVPVIIPEEEEETAEETVPKIVASEFTTAPEIVKAGNSFTLQIGFTNTHEDKSIRNAKVSLEDSRNVLAPIGSSNTLYISSIAPGSTVYRELQLQAHPDAQPDIYEVVLNIEYEDADGNQYTAEESAGIAIMQQASLSTGTVRLDEAVAGKPTTLYVEFYNTGRSKIYSLMVTAAGEDLMIDAPTYFVGNFEAGSSDYFQTDVIATTPGKYEGEVVFTYEDAAGEKYELRRPFTVYADEATSFTPTLGGSGSINTDKPQDTEETEKEGLSVQLYILLGSLVLLAGVGIIFLLQRRRNKDVLIND